MSPSYQLPCKSCKNFYRSSYTLHPILSHIVMSPLSVISRHNITPQQDKEIIDRVNNSNILFSDIR